MDKDKDSVLFRVKWSFDASTPEGEMFEHFNQMDNLRQSEIVGSLMSQYYLEVAFLNGELSSNSSEDEDLAKRKRLCVLLISQLEQRLIYLQGIAEKTGIVSTRQAPSPSALTPKDSVATELPSSVEVSIKPTVNSNDVSSSNTRSISPSNILGLGATFALDDGLDDGTESDWDDDEDEYDDLPNPYDDGI